MNANCLPEAAFLETDLCIIGSGPAGISLAREFIGTSVQVYLLESGDVTASLEAQTLSECETHSEPFFSLQATRNRQFGGNSNVWAIKIGRQQMGVRYAPLDGIDFEQRDWVPHSGWPFAKAELDPFYERAQVVCQSGPYAYDAADWQRPDSLPLPLPEQFQTAIFQFGPRQVFYETYRRELEQAENIHVCVNATVLEIEANDAVTRATRVKVSTLAGKSFWLSAKLFVLAQGGIENARLLLNSNRQQLAGLGNQHDLVGRFFMDHPLLDAGMFVPQDANLFNQTALYDLRWVDNTPILGKLAPSPGLMQAERVLNTAVLAFPRPSLRQFEAVSTFKLIAEMGLSGQLPDHLLQRLLKVLWGMDYVLLASYLALTQRQSLLHGFGRGGWSELADNRRRFKQFQLFFQTEQAPDPQNRIVLSRERDRFGLQKAALHWKWGELERISAEKTHQALADAFVQARLGQLQGSPKLCAPGVAHHMGTTRMHLNPKQGVVDSTGRMHQLSNLYIAGSSVFPTGGSANPTLTIVALSLRLADHLKSSLLKR